MLRADMDRKALAITPPLLLLSSFFFHLRYHPFLYNSPLSFYFFFLARQPFYDDGSLLFLTEAHQSFDFFLFSRALIVVGSSKSLLFYALYCWVFSFAINRNSQSLLCRFTVSRTLLISSNDTLSFWVLF